MSAADASELLPSCVAGGAGCSSGPTEMASPAARDQDQATAPTANGAAVEPTPFTGQIVHNRDGSLVIVDADVPWVSEPDSIVDDGSGRAPSVVAPPPIRSALFIRRRRAARSERPEAGAPPGLTVDRYRVCGVDGDVNFACELIGAPETSPSASGRTNITCCVCRLCFGATSAFEAHCVGAHGVSLEGAPMRFLSRPDAAAVLATAGADRRPSVSLLRFSPCPSDTDTESAAPQALIESERGVIGRSWEGGRRAREQSALSDSAGTCGSLKSLTFAGRVVSSSADSSATVASSVSAGDGAPSQLDIARSLTEASQASAVSVAASSTLKTLKCPRCNWHFKYRDTLEAHLREKHADDGSACGFCLSGQPHPRLSRGEAHDCGYKPYRCDVCHYATTTKGNLSIHMQSDKHLNNVQERQLALRNLRAPGEKTEKGGNAGTSLRGPTENSLQGDENSGHREVLHPKLKALSDAATRLSPGERETTLGDKIAVWLAKQPDLSRQDEKPNNAIQLGNVPTTQQPNPRKHLNPQQMFTCCTCGVFSTDSLEELEQHMHRERSGAHSGDFTVVVDGQQLCVLCVYRTHLRANFLLHCQSDKHVQKLKHFLHILEGGAENLWQLSYLHTASPVDVRCNLCEISTGTGVQLRMHTAEGRHLANCALWAHIRRAELGVPAGRRRYHCALCGYSARHVLLLLRHAASLLHLGRERGRHVERQHNAVGPQEEDTLCFSVRDAGSNADNDPEEIFGPTEAHAELQHMDSSGLQTNGFNGTALGGAKMDAMNSWQPNTGYADGQLPAMCNGRIKHESSVPENYCQSNRLTEGAPGSVSSGEGNGDIQRKAKWGKVPTKRSDTASGVTSAKTPFVKNLKSEDSGSMTGNETADQNANIDSGEDGNRPYKCHACNVAYGHPQILAIHLQSKLHEARADAENLRSSVTEALSQVESKRVPNSDPDSGMSRTGEIDKNCIGMSSIRSNNEEARSLPMDASETRADELTILAVKRDADGHYRASKQEEKALNDEQHAEMIGLRVTERPASRSKHVTDTRRPSPTEHESQPIKDQLLEMYGLELAMHHCETRRKRQKTNAESEETTAINLSSWLSDVDGYVCPLCQKSFSGLWIFKVHAEEIHHQYVPRDLLEVHIDVLSQELHRRRNLNSDVSKKDTESQLNETAEVSQPELQKRGGQAPPAPSVAGADIETKTSVKPENSRPSSPPSAPHLPVPDIQAALSLIQAAQICYQMQQLNPLLASQMAAFGFPPAAFGLGDSSAQYPHLMSLMAAQQFLNPSMLWAAQAQALAQQQQQAQIPPAVDVDGSISSQSAEGRRPADLSTVGSREEKRARTRINGYQLKMLRAHFEVDRTPSDEVVRELGRQCGLLPKVVKHWFRNTLFKERQRDKDSPYNFSVPPEAPLNLHQSGQPELSVRQSSELRSSSISIGDENVGSESKSASSDAKTTTQRTTSPEVMSENSVAVDLSSRTPFLPHRSSLTSGPSHHHSSSLPSSSSPPPAHNSSLPPGTRLAKVLQTDLDWGASVTREYGELSITLPGRFPFQQSPSSGDSSPATHGSPMWSEISPPEGQKGANRRANRTRFTDHQVKVLQDFFEKNAYPKEEDLRHLSNVLNLGPRVIVVWFQNARQKVRKVFENHPSPPPSELNEEKSSRFQRTAELNYQCNRCKMVYQRYQELVRHQRQNCYREESSKPLDKTQEPRPEARGPSVSVAEIKATPQDNTYKCGKCPQEFDRFDRWREHQVVHVMNPSVVPSSRQNQFSGSTTGPPSSRSSHSAEEASEEETDDSTVWDRHSQERRLRTSINPEQLEVLQRTYRLNSTPRRETLEAIARGTGLRKRVVQVWFQNARARERKSQAVAQVPMSVTYSGPTETVVKVKITEPKVGPEVSVELVKTYSKAASPNAVVCKQSGKREESDVSSRLAEFTAVRHPVVEARLQAPPSHPAEAPLDLRKSNSSAPPAASNLTASKPIPRVVPPVGRKVTSVVDAPLNSNPIQLVSRDMAQLTALPLLPSRESLPWSVSLASDSTSTASASASPPTAAASARPSFAVTNKRFRTQMSPGQVSVLRSVFSAYRMPTMAECARLGAEIGLAKRVVQVWFQNSRAKEKKRQLQSGRPPTPAPHGCDLCRVSYGVKCSMQEHLLSRAHIELVQRETERKRAAPPAAGGSALASGAAGAVAASRTAPPPLQSPIAATSGVRPAPPPQPTTREHVDDGAGTVSRPATAAPPGGPPAAVSALRARLQGGAAGSPHTSIGDATCDPSARPAAVSEGAVPMATSVG